MSFPDLLAGCTHDFALGVCARRDSYGCFALLVDASSLSLDGVCEVQPAFETFLNLTCRDYDRFAASVAIANSHQLRFFGGLKEYFVDAHSQTTPAQKGFRLLGVSSGRSYEVCDLF